MSSHPHDRVSLTVVRFLGSAALLAIGGSIFLVWSATQFDGIDPSTVALVGGVGALASAALGALGAILATTGKAAPTPVTVENPPSDPAAVSVVPAAPALDGGETPL